jgi:hypothetical protein
MYYIHDYFLLDPYVHTRLVYDYLYLKLIGYSSISYGSLMICFTIVTTAVYRVG